MGTCHTHKYLQIYSHAHQEISLSSKNEANGATGLSHKDIKNKFINILLRCEHNKKREADDIQALNWCEIIPLKTYLINHNQSPIKQTVTLQYGIEKKKKLENHSIYYESLLNLVSSTHKKRLLEWILSSLALLFVSSSLQVVQPELLVKGNFLLSSFISTL